MTGLCRKLRHKPSKAWFPSRPDAILAPFSVSVARSVFSAIARVQNRTLIRRVYCVRVVTVL